MSARRRLGTAAATVVLALLGTAAVPASALASSAHARHVKPAGSSWTGRTQRQTPRQGHSHGGVAWTGRSHDGTAWAGVPADGNSWT